MSVDDWEVCGRGMFADRITHEPRRSSHIARAIGSRLHIHNILKIDALTYGSVIVSVKLIPKVHKDDPPDFGVVIPAKTGIQPDRRLSYERSGSRVK